MDLWPRLSNRFALAALLAVASCSFLIAGYGEAAKLCFLSSTLSVVISRSKIKQKVTATQGWLIAATFAGLIVLTTILIALDLAFFSLHVGKMLSHPAVAIPLTACWLWVILYAWKRDARAEATASSRIDRG